MVSFIFYNLQRLTEKSTAQVDHTYLNIADHIELPVNNPVLIFAIILFIILISPVVLKKFRVPGILGLIVSGIIIFILVTCFVSSLVTEAAGRKLALGGKQGFIYGHRGRPRNNYHFPLKFAEHGKTY